MAQSKTSGKFTTPLMILAILSAGGFLYWLSVASEPTEFTVAAEDPQDMVVPVDAQRLAEDAAAWVDRRVQVGPVVVTDVGNPDAVWFGLEDESEYLVRLSRPLVDGGLRILEGEAVRFVGTVHMMSDSVLDAWTAEGIITDDGARGRMGSALSYLFAVSAEIQGRPEADESES